MIAATTIEAVRSADIVQVVGHFVKLDRHQKACCPFHDEKSPSFSVSAEKHQFKCFGCGEGGDAIRFVMLHERKDFIGAVEVIANICGISIEYEKNYDAAAVKEKREELQSLRQHLQFAQAHFTAALRKSTDALAYAHGRMGDDDVLAKWGIGYAPDNYSLLTDQYKTKGHLDKAAKLGIIREDKEKEGKYYDFFRNRLTFAITDTNNELITFAGRTIVKDGKGPKYLNGAQSPLYDKSSILYGMYHAIPGIKKHGFAILTEGYLDVISMHRAGADNTVATCGTALSKQHLALLKRYTDTIVIMRDGDAAGDKAMRKDAELAIPMGFKVQVMPLPEGQDPDDYAKEFINTNNAAAA